MDMQAGAPKPGIDGRTPSRKPLTSKQKQSRRSPSEKNELEYALPQIRAVAPHQAASRWPRISSAKNMPPTQTTADRCATTKAIVADSTGVVHVYLP